MAWFIAKENQYKFRIAGKNPVIVKLKKGSHLKYLIIGSIIGNATPDRRAGDIVIEYEVKQADKMGNIQ